MIADILDEQVLLILDLQVGLYNMARDFDSTLYHNAMIAHAAVGKLFDLPVIMTTSAEQGMIFLKPLPLLHVFFRLPHHVPHDFCTQ